MHTRLESSLLIAIEGPFGSGVTTQCKAIVNNLNAQNIFNMLTYEPTDSPMGKLIRKSFTQKFSADSLLADYKNDVDAFIRLYSADCAYHMNSMLCCNNTAKVIICDHYYYLPFIYCELPFLINSPKSESDLTAALAKFKSLFWDIRIPDLVIVLDTDFNNVYDKRLKARKKYKVPLSYDLYYRDLPKYFSKHNIRIIDGSATLATVTENCVNLVNKLVQKSSVQELSTSSLRGLLCQ